MHVVSSALLRVYARMRTRELSRQLRYGLTTAVTLLFSTGGVSIDARREVAVQGGSCTAQTALGDVVGVRRGEACAYLGVPYAEPPIGDLRWRPPRPRAPWAPGVVMATSAPSNCASLNVATGAPGGSEDCLTLNIWTPASVSGSRLPVLVWLHTGGFLAASSSFPSHDGQRFAVERGAIIVAPNYRLGPFGFLAHAALTQEDAGYPSSGNYGLADQRQALRWVREHIAAFGGDPLNVTLAGTSAGGTSAGLHLVSPASRGLFQRAILQSAYDTYRWPTSAEAYVQGEQLAAALGCTDRARVLQCLRQATREQVLQALPLGQLQITEAPGRVLWNPVVDGVEIPDQPRDLYRRGQFSRVPMIIGVNGDEGWTFVDRSFPSGLTGLQYESVIRDEFGMDASAVLNLYPASTFATPKDALARVTADVEFVCEARRIARVMRHDGAPVYFYSFEYPLEGVTSGRAFHGLESNFLFGNAFAAGAVPGITAARPLTASDQVIYDAMSSYWRRFIETGDPNPRGQPVQWPTYRPGPFDAPVDPSNSDRHFVFAERLGVASHLRDPQCNFWESF
jgi:para-nitrobenzyl esterase